ncbi:MAG: hypothetical protein KDK23_15310, partial [Leptospiraceae bacterium]|nr:hypothetical protein [Leptospiraceae bacterium]
NTENRIQRKFNAELEPDQCRFATSEVEERFHLETEGWTNRKRNGIRRLARSMADMSGAAEIQMEHMLEALRYAGLTESIVTSPENGKAPWQSD